MVNFISQIKATTLIRKKREGTPQIDTMYLFLSPKTIFLRFKIPLFKEEAVSSSEPTLDYSNFAKAAGYYSVVYWACP
jgi:hypothetical protein